ncbi:phosphopantetheine-binding protein [Streptomyces xinghaiensis]|uniref:phosphopantetheine-binding protein n=1 Tax=Streptomyces xinghaiensis TaxID=1038928 RepID=UPI000300E5A0|nr:phosphopantetheine-binding protein [Streptomyces xinghaiensis]MZE76257.1 acyl carrier protein [Streptomyces sp. SID5475]
MDQAVQDIGDAVDSALAKFIRVPYTPDSELSRIGLDSLSIVRIVVEVVPDADQEIDAGELAGLRTVGGFREWLRGLAASGGAR